MKATDKKAKRAALTRELERREKLFKKAKAGDVKSMILCGVFMGMYDAKEAYDFLEEYKDLL